jgi:nickel-dependent lactate racemase
MVPPPCEGSKDERAPIGRSRCTDAQQGESIIRSMEIGIHYGRAHVNLKVAGNGLVEVRRQPPAPALDDPLRTLSDALERPLGFPALRQALTPDDHVALVVDDRMPSLPGLLGPVLEHLAGAGVAGQSVTVVCPPGAASRPWVDGLPGGFRDVPVEVHDPADRRHLSYLATTRQGRRVYLNRTVVDADQVIVLSRRRFEPFLGYAGAEGALYPALSDLQTRQETWGHLSLAAPGKKPWPARREAEEISWLLGAPFMIQLIEGAGQSLAHVVAGLADTGEEAVRLLNDRWRVSVDGMADIVIAALTGDRDQHTFADLADALTCASRVVKPDGRIILLTEAQPVLGAGAALLREADAPEQALEALRRQSPPDLVASFQWASAAQRARIYLLSELPPETAEELFTVPLDSADQVQRLLKDGDQCLVLEDANKTLAVPKE